jgi:Raf kinase inhibitor-like YbhB/YbcL family protein
MRQRRIVLMLLSLLILAAMVLSCAPTPSPTPTPAPTLSLSSTAFKDGDNMPTKYTCSGQNVSPPLAWNAPPAGTQAFALIVDDPDAPSGVFTHWVLFNLPPSTRELAEGVPTQEQLPNDALQGKNDSGKIGYGGPCPPPGPSHRYRFNIYAIDKLLNLTAGTSKQQVLDAMQGHILAQALLTATYQR